MNPTDIKKAVLRRITPGKKFGLNCCVQASVGLGIMMIRFLLLLGHIILGIWGILVTYDAYNSNVFDNNDCSLRTITLYARIVSLIHVFSSILYIIGAFISCVLFFCIFCTLSASFVLDFIFFVSSFVFILLTISSINPCDLNGITDPQLGVEMTTHFERLSTYIWFNFGFYLGMGVFTFVVLFIPFIQIFTLCCGCYCTVRKAGRSNISKVLLKKFKDPTFWRAVVERFSDGEYNVIIEEIVQEIQDETREAKANEKIEKDVNDIIVADNAIQNVQEDKELGEILDNTNDSESTEDYSTFSSSDIEGSNESSIYSESTDSTDY